MKTELMPREEHYVSPDSNLAKKELLLLEATKAWGESYFRIGIVLRSIYDDKDWKDGNFSSFEDYMNVRQPLGMNSRHGFRLMAASEKRKLLPDLNGTDRFGQSATWSEWTIRPLTHKDFKPSDVRRLGKKIATQVKRGERLTATLVKSICDEDRGVPRQQRERKAKKLADADSPAKTLRRLKVDIELWQSSLAELPAHFWSDAEEEDPGCLKRAIGAVSELASFLRS